MNFDFLNNHMFVEHYLPSKSSLFDIEIDNLVTAYVKKHKTIQGIDNFTGKKCLFTAEHNNWRETLLANTSQSFSRQRLLVCGLSLALTGRADSSLPQLINYINSHKLKVYSTEANGALFRNFKKNIKEKLFTYSEFFDPSMKSGQKMKKIMHQDLQKTSFKNASFDIILSSEVFEHIPDAPRAEREIVRILKPGGFYIFTIPFYTHTTKDEIRAIVTKNGETKYLLPAQYHGDPVRPEKGVLVYRIFGWKDLHTRFERMGCSIVTIRIWSKQYGIIGDNGFVHIAYKEQPK